MLEHKILASFDNKWALWQISLSYKKDNLYNDWVTCCIEIEIMPTDYLPGNISEINRDKTLFTIE